MTPYEQQRFDFLYEQHLTNLRLQGKRKATIDAYSRAVRRIAAHFDRCPDNLEHHELKRYFDALIQSHSWSTVKIDRNGLQFFYRYTLDKQWQWLNIVKPQQVKRLPDVLSVAEVALIISRTRQLRYQVLFFTLYSLGLRLSEAINLTVADIDSANMQVHVRDGIGGKDRLVPLPRRTLAVLRHFWQHHRHRKWLFPSNNLDPNQQTDRGGAQKAMRRVVTDRGIHKKNQPSYFASLLCYSPAGTWC